jgi:hypothetical protein
MTVKKVFLGVEGFQRLNQTELNYRSARFYHHYK